MKATSHTQSRLLLVIALFFSMTFSIESNGQTINLVSDSLQTHVYAFADDAAAPCNPPPFFDESEFNIPVHNMVAGLFGYSFATQYGVEALDRCEAISNSNASAFYGVDGNGTNSASVTWTQFGQSYHSAPFCPDGYVANSFSNSHATMNFVISGVPNGTPVTVFYSYSAYSGAFPNPEAISEDTASITPFISIDGIDLFSSAGVNMNFGNPPMTSGNRRHDNLGSIDVIAGQPFSIILDGLLRTRVTNPPIFSSAIGSPCTQKDRATAAFSGILEMRLSVPFTLPPPNPIGLEKYFSVDIGSANEFSNPAPNGSEVFDPGDAYAFHAPLLPIGGADGFIDDATFMAGDIFPSPPEVGPPYATAAPSGSGIPIGTIHSNFFDMDGLDMLDFIVVPDAAGPQIINTGPCLFDYKHLFLSFDDDDAPNYASGPPSVPINSSSALNHFVFGEVSNKDEIVESRTSIFNLNQSLTFPWYNEEDVHPNLAPNPIFDIDPLSYNEEDDDVDALDFNEAGVCQQVYVSVDHEARGIDASGITPDPGIIYRVGAPGIGLIPSVIQSDIGIPLGTDINAFEFVSLPDIGQLFSNLLLVYSVDVDDPLTLTDESGGLMPDVLYGSFLDGISFPMDTTPSNFDNIDAITTWAHSLTPITYGNTCRQSNFPTAPTNWHTVILPNHVRFAFDAVPFSTTCQIRGGEVSNPNDTGLLFTNNGLPPKQKDFWLGALQPNTQYRVKVRCGCFDANNVARATPFTPYIFFTTPPMIQNENDGNGILDALTTPSLKLFPNPASESVQLSLADFNSPSALLRLYDYTGKLIYENNLALTSDLFTYELNISNWSSGLYLISIRTDEKEFTENLIVE